MTPGGVPDFEVRVADWLDVEAAQRRIIEGAFALDAERVPLAETAGRALAEDLVAQATLPPWDNAAMDGYAVRGDDVRGATADRPVSLTVRGQTRAGEPPGEQIGRGDAMRIMTGAPLPVGADSVVRVEDTDAEADPGLVRVLRDRDTGRNVRPRGQDMRSGQVVLTRGASIHPGTVGVLAALGRSSVLVGRRPTVHILTTGDELRPPEAYQDVCDGFGVPESNGAMLAAAVADAGGVARLSGIVPDDPSALAEAIRNGGREDVLVTVGGASMGEADLVKRVLDSFGFRQDFWRVKLRPGSPFSFGWLPREGGRQAVFGLPGNPTSAFVTFEVFVRPFLLRIAGHARIHRQRISCLAGEELPGTRRTILLRVRLEDGDDAPIARLTGAQGSGLVLGLASAEGLAIIPQGRTIPAGGRVEVLLLGHGPAARATSPFHGLEP